MKLEYKVSNDPKLFRLYIKSDLLTEEQAEMIEVWLISDVIFPERTLKEISLALNSQDDIKPICVGGNAFWCDVGKEYTWITYQYEDDFDEGKCPYKPCKIPTKLVYEIVKVWSEEREKWKKKYNKGAITGAKTGIFDNVKKLFSKK